MTAYELFDKAYRHHTGQFLGRIVLNSEDRGYKAREYVQQSFIGMLSQYTVEYAGSNGLNLSFGVYSDDTPAVDVDVLLADKELQNTQCLKGIEVSQGHWLIHYDGHTGDWNFSHYIFKEEAVARRNEWRKIEFKYVDWFWIVKVGYDGLDI